ncbi:ABC transporter permease [Calidifontibacter sp. DB0510]|uniref:ABC transporter permease n=1 Tax=Metallococcus carri TaxID=1656884 RepID=A0A967B2E3_9MICO|nr:ABC transporter permease [Metallococcus carri]NHN56724.1 ABC transporter permease [Metallococcus carri]NOP37899.1 ABC transporter permease [Calidifontibacter sp. DB2511S]
MITSIWTWLTAPAQWSGAGGIPTRLWEHIWACLLVLVIAAAIAWPLGAWIAHAGRGRWLISVANAARAVPSLGLLFAVAMWMSGMFSGSTLAFTIPPTIVLVILAIPPLLAGAYAGVHEVDPAVRDAARGMGMTGGEVLRKVELPIALPLILSGLRSASLQVIATWTIAAVLSVGGLGRYLIDGLASADYAQMAGGAVLVAVLALLVDGMLALLQRLVVSPGLTGRRRRRARTGIPRATASRPTA